MNLDLQAGFAFCHDGNGSGAASARIASTSNSNPITNKKEMDVSSKLKSNGGAESQATSTPPGKGEVSVGNSERAEEIRHRAYEIDLESGEQLGRELDDWPQAELELEGLELAQAG
jgi:hypothetical protein